MRGCLSVLVLAVAIVAGATWFGGRTVAAAVVEGALGAVGLQASSETVEVDAAPPLELLVGRADAIRVHLVGMTFRGLSADRADFTFSGVDLASRTIARVDGTLTNVALPAASAGGQSGISASSVVVTSAPAGTTPRLGPTIEIAVPAGDVERIVADAVVAVTGVRPSRVALAAPDLVTIVVAGLSIEGRLVVTNGEIGLVAGRLGTVGILSPPASLRLTLDAIAVEPTGVRLTGTLDLPGITP